MPATMSSNELNPPDIVLPLTYSAVSFVVSFLLVKVFSPLISPLLYDTYSRLDRRKQLDWDTRVASNVHSILVCTLLCIIFLSEDSIYQNPVWGDSLLGRCTCGIVSGYIASDVVIILAHWQYLGDVAFLVHHAATLIPYVLVLKYGVMLFFALYRLWAELSTPFVNKRWILETLKYPKGSRAYIVNGLVMTGTFFLCRVATIPYWYYTMYHTLHSPDFSPETTWIFYWIAFWSCVVLDILNIAWMVKIFRGAVKLLISLDKNQNKTVKGE